MGGMKIAIIGFDIEGRATYNYFRKGDHAITICDQTSDLAVPSGCDAVLGPHYLDDLDRFDMIVRTAGLHPKLILEKNPGVQAKITSHINEFMKASPTQNIIGVTGTKGKGTTATLITEILKADGKVTYLGGNIGVPPLSFIDALQADSYVVLELSSFQLIDLKTSPHIGVCLMVAPEHLNWHEDFEEYLASKQQLFIHQRKSDIAIYLADDDNSISVADATRGQQIPYMETPGAYVAGSAITISGQVVCQVDELKLLGQHNWQNVCAAITTVWVVTANLAAIRSAVTTFSGLPHRLELVRQFKGITYYDDSFGTTPETAIVALQAFSQPKVVILGGSDKGAAYDKLAQTVVTSTVRHVITIGATGPAIATALAAAGYTDGISEAATMADIVQTAATVAEPGDVVLLSAACASFDMFKNYKDRAEQFQAAVRQLAD